MEKGLEGNVECWFEDSVIRYDVGDGMQSDEHVTLMLTDTDEYETRLVGFFTDSLMWASIHTRGVGRIAMANGKLTMVGESDKRPARIHDLVKAPANTAWAQERKISWDA